MSALYSHRFDHGWTGSAALYLMSDMDWPNEGDSLQSYDRLDLRLARKFRLGGNDLLAELIVQNALDRPYLEFRHQNTFERRFYVRLKIDLE